MSTITLISQTIDILYTGCLYGLISFVGIKLVTQIPTWWAQSDPRKQAAADTLPAPTHQTEVTDVKTPEVIAEIEVNKNLRL